jgi:hypothetical protein
MSVDDTEQVRHRPCAQMALAEEGQFALASIRADDCLALHQLAAARRLWQRTACPHFRGAHAADDRFRPLSEDVADACIDDISVARVGADQQSLLDERAGPRSSCGLLLPCERDHEVPGGPR